MSTDRSSGPAEQPIRIAFDAAPLAPPRTGIGNVTFELISRLARKPALNLSGYCLGIRGRDRAFAALPDGVAALHRPVPARPMRRLWLHTGRPTFERTHGRFDLVHGTNFVVPPTGSTPALVTAHDMVSALHPEVVEPSSRLFPQLIGNAIERGAHVQVAAHSVATEVSEAYGIGLDRITVIYNGVTPVGPADPAEGRRLSGFDRYILAVGTVEPRKRFGDLVAAFDRIAAAVPDLGLVIAGADGWGTEALDAAIDRATSRDRIRRLGWVDNPAALMRGATALAFPSLYEGFGLPPLEAMSANVPVVATRAGAVPEICGDAVRLVPVGDIDELAGELEAVVLDDDLRADLIEKGRHHVQRFDWDVAAAEHADLYRMLTRARVSS